MTFTDPAIALAIALVSLIITLIGAWDKISSIIQVSRKARTRKKIAALEDNISRINKALSTPSLVVAQCSVELGMLISSGLFVILADLSLSKDASYVEVVEYFYYGFALLVGMVMGNLFVLRDNLRDPQKKIESLQAYKQILLGKEKNIHG
ncbi:hypothetical protein [Marinagarivorans cellulosilyticus]|uniref:DUF2721 domain-containing protein n=1 Tax=Marinagarivorans cellulosilyticus TaxID=2721545 RepID=A0AAN1WJQ3_9GAMM|nr:hypothetical protein [Marinagarivorans cellulosilyticus]BCD98861.1 hypothetical protein MARGE09_P3062 [Marinagarivorans cellulosilyticus]